MVSSIARGQEEESYKFRFSTGLSGGLGQNIHAYKLSADSKGFTYYGIDPHYSIGVDAGLYVSNKIRIRFELRYVEMKYGMNWNEPYPDFDKTVTSLYNMDLNLHFDYSVFRNKHLDFMISPSIIYEYVMKDEFKNTLADGSVNYKVYNILSTEYPDNILGGNFSIPVKYKINEYIGVTLTPGYTYFFRNFLLSNDKPYQRLSINLGAEFLLY